MPFVCTDGQVPVLEKPESGQPCCALFTHTPISWGRGQVISPQQDTSLLEIYSVDFGFTEMVEPQNVKLLTQPFLALPAQAIRCSLAGVKPSSAAWNPGEHLHASVDLLLWG